MGRVILIPTVGRAWSVADEGASGVVASSLVFGAAVVSDGLPKDAATRTSQHIIPGQKLEAVDAVVAVAAADTAKELQLGDDEAAVADEKQLDRGS